MAVVTLNSTVFGSTGAAGYTAPNSTARDGHPHVVAGRVTNAATDNTGSKYLLAQIPWGAILQPSTAFLTKDWGFAQAVIGVDEDMDCILDAAKGTAVGGQLPITIFTSKWNVPLWQACGLSAMPTDKAFANVYAVAEADAAGAGTLDFHIEYALHV